MTQVAEQPSTGTRPSPDAPRGPASDVGTPGVAGSARRPGRGLRVSRRLARTGRGVVRRNRHGLVVTGVVVGAWWLVCALRLKSAYVLPPPDRVWEAAVAMTTSGELARHVVTSLGRVGAGFALAFALAFGVGVLAVVAPRVHAYLSPALDFLKNVPPLALIPLLILWFGIGETPKLVVIVLTAVFPMSMGITKGLRSCGQDLLDVGTSLHLSPARTFVLIRLPHALPDVLVGMRVSLGYAWRALVGAEMFAAAAGLGALIVDAGNMARSDKVIVGVIAIGAVGLATDRLFARLVRRYLRWGIDDSWR